MFNLFSIIVVGLVLFISLLLKFLEYVEIITVPNLAQKLLKTTIKIASVYLVIATLIIVFWPKNDRQIRKIISNQVKVETEKAKEALTVLEKKSKNGLSLDEIRKAKNLKKQIEETEEYYECGDFEEKKIISKPASAKPKEEVIITKPVSNDLLTGAYLSWQKPDDYAGKEPETREAVFKIKITRLDNEKLVFLDSNGKDTTDCTWKEKSQKYQGQWEKDGKIGFIEFTPIYKNGKIVSFCGAMGSKNKKPNSSCWITGDIP